MPKAGATLLLATTNRGKLRELTAILAGLPFELITLADGPPVEAPEETGRTFKENARLKALYYASTATGQLTVAEDSGLEIDVLGGIPGVESARFGGVDSTYPEKFALIAEQLRGRRDALLSSTGASAVESITARFVCALALARGGRLLFESRGSVEGEITERPRGEDGFGYDPIFYYPPFKRTLAEVSPEQKSAVSHRGQAVRALRDYLIESMDL